MNTIVFHPESDPNAVRDAAAILRRGGLLGIPTETVYGLGADALNEDAVSRIFLAKGRPQDNPLIIHVPDASWLERYCRDVPPAAYRLAERFWPGPLTMILPRRDIVPLQTTGGLETVGVRCPNHPVTLAIIEAAGVPIAAPSGNTSGRPSPTTAAHMIEDMDGRIDGIVDGGPCTVGVESTIIDLTVTPPRLLRPGGLPLESLRQVLGEVAVDKAVTGLLAAGERPRAPGMKYRHYAPHAPVADGCRLIDLLRRPQVSYEDLRPFDPADPDLPPAVREQVEITVKYEGYIRRQEKQVEEFEKLERRRLPPDMDYRHIQGLRLEAREKLAALRPENLGQAGRISGVSPADVAALMVYLHTRERPEGGKQA